MHWPEPTAYLVGLGALMTVGVLLPLRFDRREDPIILTMTSTVSGGVLGMRSLVLVWAALAAAAPLRALWEVAGPRRWRRGWRAAVRSMGWALVSVVTITLGTVVSVVLYTEGFDREFPVQAVPAREMAVAGTLVTVAWAITMSARLVMVRLLGHPSLPLALDPFESVLLPYLLPFIGGFPLVTASVALYRPDEPWPSLWILWWCFPLYVASAYELRRQRMARELRRDALATQRLAAIGEVSARIVHQSRHQVGLMGWSLHRLRGLLGGGRPVAGADLDAALAELDNLAEAKDRLGTMLTAELLHERTPGDTRPGAGAGAPRSEGGQRGVEPHDPEGDLGARSGGLRSDIGATEPGSTPPDPSLDDVVHDVLDQLAAKADRRGVALRPPTTATTVTVDPALRDVVFNLVDNAVDAATSEVAVTTVDLGSAVEVCVRDDGDGLGAVEVRRAFEPFFTTKADGTGMGLAIADALLADRGGELRYERGDGETTFRMRLPTPRAD